MPPQRSPARRGPRFARLLVAQAVIGILAAGIAAAVGGANAALAAALGAATCLLPQAWFVWRVFGTAGRGGAPDARALLRALYRGEAIKLAAIAVLLIGIFRLWPEVPPVPLMLGFIAVQTVHWFTPLLLEE